MLSRGRLPRGARPGHGPDAGVIAIIVALSISTFILGFSALAVDLGSAYSRKADLGAMADHLALAAASGLPSTGDALTAMNKTLTGMCADAATPGVCNPDGTVAGTGWEINGLPADGEVTFYTDSNGDGRYSLADQITNLASPGISAVQVLLPPSTVEFGLAGALGFDSATLHKSATARIGTALGSGVLPFALTSADLTVGQFCVAASPPISTTFPIWDEPVPNGDPYTVTASTTDPLTFPVGGGTLGLLTMTLNAPDTAPVPATTQLTGVGVRFSNSNTEFHPLEHNGQYANIDIPPGDPGTTRYLWVIGHVNYGSFNGSFTSNEIAIHYAGTPVPGATLCEQPSAGRGYLNLARPEASPVPLRPNIRSGPIVHLFPAASPISLGGVLNCVATVFAPATDCLSATTGTTFNTDLTNGLLRRSPTTAAIPGRLIGTCTGKTLTSHGISGIDASSIFDQNDGMLNLAHGSSDALEKRLTGLAGPELDAGSGDQGWITSKALRCPRMAVMPVVDHGFTGANQDIKSFRYVWIGDRSDGVHRGLNGDGSQVTSFQGYIIDPAYLPSLVSGSSQVGPFLGTDMPKEALLIHDLGGPAT